MAKPLFSTLFILFSSISITFSQAEFKAEYPQKVNEILAKNLKFPAESRQKREGGNILLSIKIDSKGMLDSVFVLEESHAPLMNEVMKSVAILKENWEPEYLEGREFDTKYLLNFNFKSELARGRPISYKTAVSKLIEKEKYQEAMEEIERLIAENPYDPELYFLRSQVYNNTGETTKFQEDFMKTRYLKKEMLSVVIIQAVR